MHAPLLANPDEKLSILTLFRLPVFDLGPGAERRRDLAHQNRTIAIASDFRVDGAKSPEIPQKEEVLGSEIATRNRKSLATFHRTLKSQCSIAFSCLRNRAISGVRVGHRNRKSQKSLRFRCAKPRELLFPTLGPEAQMTPVAGKSSRKEASFFLSALF